MYIYIIYIYIKLTQLIVQKNVIIFFYKLNVLVIIFPFKYLLFLPFCDTSPFKKLFVIPPHTAHFYPHCSNYGV